MNRRDWLFCVGLSLVISTGMAFVLSTVAIKSFYFANLQFSAYDFGIHVQALFKTAFGMDFFNSVRGLNTLGDHVWMIDYVVAPIYRLFPTGETLFIVQSVCHGICGLLIFLFCRSVGISALLCTAWGVAALLHPALWFMNMESFHPETIATPLLIGTFAAVYHKRWRLCFLLACLAVLCKEDVAITMFGVGMWTALFRSRRMGFLLCVFSGVWFLLAMKVILPLANGVGFFRASGNYWFTGIFSANSLIKFVFERVLTERSWNYYCELMQSLGWFGWLRLDVHALLLPSFLINCISGSVYLMSIEYHYNNQTLPFLWLSSALGCHWLMMQVRLRFASWRGLLFEPALLATLLALVLIAGDFERLPGGVRHAARLIQSRGANYYQSLYELRLIEEVFAKDPEVRIATPHNLVPNLANRRTIYMLPNPWRPQLWGINGEYGPLPPLHPHLLVYSVGEAQAVESELGAYPCRTTVIWRGTALEVRAVALGQDPNCRS